MIKKTFKTTLMFFFGLVFCINHALALDSTPNTTLDTVHLFQTFFRDAPIAAKPYVEAGIRHDDYDHGTAMVIDAQGSYPINPKCELGAGVGFISVSPDHGSDDEGLSDIMVSGKHDVARYLTFLSDDTKVSAGGYFTLPTGDEDVGEDNTDYGVFGALRHPLYSSLVLTAVAGLDFLEIPDRRGDKDRETSLLLGCGILYPVNYQIVFVGELNYWSEGDYSLVSCGLDRTLLKISGKLRGVMGIGLDDGAPDFSIRISYLRSF
jgi:hypothetical protein